MSKPTTLPIWATDTTLATGSESGLSTKLEPSLGVKQQGSIPGEEAPGRWYNWLLNNIYSWCVYLNGLGTDAQFLATNFAFTGNNTHTGTELLSGAVTVANDVVYSAAKVRKVVVPVGEYASSAWVYDNGTASFLSVVPHWYSGSTAVDTPITCQVTTLPVGATLTDVRVAVQCGAAGQASVQVVLMHLNENTGVTTMTDLGTGPTNTTSGTEIITKSSLSQVIGTGDSVLIVLHSGVSTGAALYGTSVTYTETRATGS